MIIPPYPIPGKKLFYAENQKGVRKGSWIKIPLVSAYSLAVSMFSAFNCTLGVFERGILS
jgi:hypothetical protein